MLGYEQDPEHRVFYLGFVDLLAARFGWRASRADSADGQHCRVGMGVDACEVPRSR